MTQPHRVGAPLMDEDQDDTPFVQSSPSSAPASPLDELRETITKEVQRPDLVLAVMARPGMEIRFDTNVDMSMIQEWRRRATRRRGQNEDFDILKFTSSVVANQARAFRLRGEEPAGADGEPISFRSPEVLQWTSTSRALDAVRALYSVDGHIISSAGEILQAAGYSDVMEEGDEGPTRGF